MGQKIRKYQKKVVRKTKKNDRRMMLPQNPFIQVFEDV